MVEGYRSLHQSLKKFLLLRRRSAPSVFQSFVGVEEFALIEQGNPASQIVKIHAFIVTRRLP